ncbi:uncharacterized protein LOC105703111 [Orussus abietinus]|uniref:uncharacterized protein LOC105703111 n=1 Tax=Orussus abietinus TaxID=222816 RepID=UPI000625F586|nr:uncharacterized protein LOC105703111 [Orussus abietinus]
MEVVKYSILFCIVTGTSVWAQPVKRGSQSGNSSRRKISIDIKLPPCAAVSFLENGAASSDDFSGEHLGRSSAVEKADGRRKTTRDSGEVSADALGGKKNDQPRRNMGEALRAENDREETSGASDSGNPLAKSTENGTNDGDERKPDDSSSIFYQQQFQNVVSKFKTLPEGTKNQFCESLTSGAFSNPSKELEKLLENQEIPPLVDASLDQKLMDTLLRARTKAEKDYLLLIWVCDTRSKFDSKTVRSEGRRAFDNEVEIENSDSSRNSDSDEGVSEEDGS